MTDFVDTHFHIWELERFPYPWPPEDLVIHRNYSAEDLWKEMKETPVKHCVFVQCLNRHLGEAKWVEDVAKKYPFIKGIVAGIDLTHPDLEEYMKEVKDIELIKGARHILDFEEEDWITREDVGRGLKALEDNDLTYDLLVRPQHLKHVLKVVPKYPKLKFVVNHISKPLIKDQIISGWKEDIAEVAKFPNVYCKLSGLVGEADWEKWKPDDFKQYVSHVVQIFGVDRCMYGSNWPVSHVAHAKFKDVYELLQELLSDCSNSDKQKIFRDNAIKFYNLSI